VARITRKDLKTDKFALEVGHTVDYFEEHRREVLLYGGIALALVLVILAVWMWRGRQHQARESALAQAIQVQEAPVGPASGTHLTFPTQQAKDAEAIKRFSELASKYSGSEEAEIAEYYLASIDANAGKIGDAERRYQRVADNAGGRVASLAKLSLGELLFATGRNVQGEQVLRSLVDKPSEFVSKEQATLALARQLAPTKPAEARKLLEPLRTSSSSSVSQMAIQLYSELPAQ